MTNVMGIPVIVSGAVRHGQALLMDNRVFVHPLTAIALEHVGDPIGRLHAAMRWFERRAHAKLDRAAADLGGAE